MEELVGVLRTDIVGGLRPLIGESEAIVAVEWHAKTGEWRALILTHAGSVESTALVEGTGSTKSEQHLCISAVTSGLKYLTSPKKVKVFCNLAFVADAVNNGWCIQWRARGWKESDGRPIAHERAWQEYLDASAIHRVRCVA